MTIGTTIRDNWVSYLTKSGALFAVIYIVSMFLVPAFSGDWGYVQRVWHNWQSFNVGMLAFLSSVVALNISIYNATTQKGREFIAARAFLPEALSDLSAYFNDCAPVLKNAYDRAKNKEDKCKTPLKGSIPELPSTYKATFTNCIKFSDPDTGDYLANVLVLLQVHHSRIQDLSQNFSEDSSTLVLPQNVMSYIFCLAELKALVGKAFCFARGRGQLDDSSLSIDLLHNAYHNLKICVEKIDGLESLTQASLER